MTDAKYDIVLFGATGYTGGLTAEYLARARTPRPLRWALAGRNPEKLQALRARLSEVGSQREGRGSTAEPNIDVISADAGDEASLRAMARSTKVVITTVGPYLRYGEPLVRACVEERADYVDLTGEPLFVDQMIERYHARAHEHRVKIVNACGFDSVPHDLGTYFAIKKLREKVGSLEDQSVEVAGLVRARGSVSGGTWHSALGFMAEMSKPTPKPHLPQVGEHRWIRTEKPRVHYEPALKKWALPLPTIDPAVVCRSARLYPDYGKEFRYGHYVALPNLAVVGGALLGMGTLFALAQLRPTRELLLKLRDPGEGPSEGARSRSWFTVDVLAKSQRGSVHCRVRGGDPGYGETAKMLAESALSLAFERAKTPSHYGVVPPAAAFGDVLLERLEAAGIGFDCLDARLSQNESPKSPHKSTSPS